MFACPLCKARSFGFWQVVLTSPSRPLRCADCQGEVGVHQPSRGHALLLAMLGGWVGVRSHRHAWLDATIVLGLLLWLGWLLHRGLYLMPLQRTPADSAGAAEPEHSDSRSP